MKLIFHGAAKEVGRSCIELQTRGERYLLDAGIKFQEGGFAYPEAVINIADLDGLLISHAHLDHSGALPMFEHYNIICPIFCTELTYHLIKILLKDSYKIARIRHLHPAYEKIDLEKIESSVRFVKYGIEYKHRQIKFMYHNAGHIPGSAMIEVTSEGKKILYTGDIKIKTTELMKGAETNYSSIDTLIIESTYGARILPDRLELKKRFLSMVEETINKGGSVLIPVFSLGRAQEILIMLLEKKFKAPVYYDGMCSKISKKILSTKDEFVNNRKILDNAKRKFIHVNSERKRENIIKKQGIFVTTSGMLQGGPVMSYLKEMWHDEKNSVFLTGFQCKRTNGRYLVDEGFVYIDGWKTYVKCAVEKFDFSGHADQNDLKEFIKKVNPKNVIFQHGDPEDLEAIKSWAENETKCKVYVPSIGDEIQI